MLPFRVLRPDPESDFLAFSLPDAIATSLSNIGSLIVRSSAVAARVAGDAPDLKALAAEADVDHVVMGTLLRSGDQVRAAAQLVEAPAGTLITSLTIQSSLGDLFQLQDDIARRVVEALSLPLAGTSSTARDVPHDAHAYELYLRANELARTYDGVKRARELYEHCLERDPTFAPAWAHLGRCLRVMTKYVDAGAGVESRAEEALRRALELNPPAGGAEVLRLPGGRSRTGAPGDGPAARRGPSTWQRPGAVRRAGPRLPLLRALRGVPGRARRGAPARSERPDERRRDAAADRQPRAPSRGGTVAARRGVNHGNRVIGLALAGRRDEARAALAEMRGSSYVPLLQTWTRYLVAWLDRRAADMVFDPSSVGGPLKIQEDPEAIFQEGWLLCEVGALERGLRSLERAVAKGYHVAPTLASSRHFDALRNEPAFRALLAEADAGRREALTAFCEAGGDRPLGVALAVRRPGRRPGREATALVARRPGHERRGPA